MIPILFDKDATTYTSNGIGTLSDVISWEVSEDLNGVYEMEMEYPVTGAHFGDIETSTIIYAEPHEGATPQPFRVYRIGKALDGRAPIYARHVSYQLNWIAVMPFTASTLADCLDKLKSYSASSNPFTFWTNKTINTGIAWKVPQSLRSMLGGTEGSVLQVYGGDYEWDGWTVKLWTRRGADNGVRIAYGKNLVSASMDENVGNAYTGVCPYWSDEETGTVVTLPEKYILASTASLYPFERIKTVDFSSDFDEAPSVAELRTRTQQYITANDIGKPNVNIEVNMAALWQTEEYADIAPLESVALGDTVTVDIPVLGISTQARVVGYVYDGVKGRYKRLSIGDAKSSFARTFVDQGRAIEASLGAAKSYTGKAVAAAKSYASSYTDSEVDKAIAEAEATAQELTENATNWLTSSGGYVVAVKNSDGSWKELLFLDTASTTTATKVLRINNHGMGFSENGVGGPYKQAWTLDGKLVVGGTDQVTISGVDASNKEIFGVTKDGISWLLKSSIMTKNGTLYFLAPGATATSGYVLRINSSGICFGRKGYNGAFSQAWAMNGKLMVGGTNYVTISAVDGSNKEIFSVTKDGISWTMAQSIMTKNGTLYFLAPGATATSGKVMRLNNLGVSFSKNGYNGTYTQSWTIDGDMTIGGKDNKYGSLTLQDRAGHVACEMNENGIDLYMYDAQGTEINNGWLNAGSIRLADSNGDADAIVSPGTVAVTDENGNAADYSGAGFSVGNVSAYYDDTDAVWVLESEELRANKVTAETLEITGGSGVSQLVKIPGGAQLTFENGILTGYTAPAHTPLHGDYEFPLGGDTLYFGEGILYWLDSLDTGDDE